MNGPKRILIVDDEPNVRLVFRTALASSSRDLAEAGDGEEALRLQRESPSDLILLDLHMPLLDGMAALRRLREAGDDVPVVIVTAHGRVPDAVEAMQLGAIDFVEKPLSPEALRAVVAEVLARHEPAGRAPAAAPAKPEVVTAAAQYAEHLTRVKRTLNRRRFDEAEVFLKQAIGLRPDSAEAHNLMGVLHELRGVHDDSYRSYRSALKADRKYVPAQHNMARYYERFTFGSSEIPIDTGDREGDGPSGGGL